MSAVAQRRADAVRVAIYNRISQDRTGERAAVTRQLEDARALAAARGWATVEPPYVDNSISAYKRTTRRPGYERMAADYRAGKFEAIITYDLDRLTRQPRQLEDWIDEAESRGLKLVTTNGEADLSTDAGRLFARIKVAVGRSEMERKGARQARAIRQRVENGKVLAGVRLTGYDDKGNVIEAEADLVRDLFQRFAAGGNATRAREIIGRRWPADSARGKVGGIDSSDFASQPPLRWPRRLQGQANRPPRGLGADRRSSALRRRASEAPGPSAQDEPRRDCAEVARLGALPMRRMRRSSSHERTAVLVSRGRARRPPDAADR